MGKELKGSVLAELSIDENLEPSLSGCVDRYGAGEVAVEGDLFWLNTGELTLRVGEWVNDDAGDREAPEPVVDGGVGNGGSPTSARDAKDCGVR